MAEPQVFPGYPPQGFDSFFGAPLTGAELSPGFLAARGQRETVRICRGLVHFHAGRGQSQWPQDGAAFDFAISASRTINTPRTARG